MIKITTIFYKKFNDINTIIQVLTSKFDWLENNQSNISV